MEKYKEMLEYLINLKKNGKKDPSRIEKENFFKAWQDFVCIEGFNSSAEEFLYEGYTYCGALPFYEYMKKAEEPLTILEKLYNGQNYGERCVNTSAILIHLLALALNDKHDETDIVLSLIKKIPSAFINKEGKRYGQADRILNKYFFDALEAEIKLPSVVEIMKYENDNTSLREFQILLQQVYSDAVVSKLQKKRQNNILKIENWLQSILASESTNTLNCDINNNTENSNLVPKNKDDKSDSGIKKDENLEIVHSDENESLNLPGNVENNKEIVCELQNEIADLKKNKSDLEQRIKILEKKDEDKEIANGQLIIKIQELKNEMADLQQKKILLEKVLVEKDKTLEQHKSMIEMLRRDRNKHSAESVKRLESKLRYLYTDYLDAKNLKMSDMLGENLRDQLGEVFKILINSGINL